MKLAIVGSRNLTVNNLEDYLPEGVTEIVSGGARGIDTCAGEYAKAHNIKLTEFRPDYLRYGRSAPLRRNVQIVDYSDEVLVFWDGKSRGTRFTLAVCFKRSKKVNILMTDEAIEDRHNKTNQKKS